MFKGRLLHLYGNKLVIEKKHFIFISIILKTKKRRLKIAVFILKKYISLDFISYKVYYNTCEGDGMVNLKPHTWQSKSRGLLQNPRQQ